VKDALKAIKYFESFQSDPYLDSAGVPTIGYGTTFYINPDKADRPITLQDLSVTEAQATQFIETYLNVICLPWISKLPGWSKFKECQKDALLVFSYNTGFKAINSGSFDTLDAALLYQLWKVPDALMRYTKDAKGNSLLGLVRRRYCEGLIWKATPFEVAIAKTNSKYPVS
jgi:lysozyme